MNEKVICDGDVIIRELGALRRITLNRPKALNAITLGMAETMTTFMRAWTDDPTVGAVLIDGDGDRAAERLHSRPDAEAGPACHGGTGGKKRR